MGKSRYAELLAHYPVLILAVILVIVTSCTLLVVLVAEPPDFSDPLQGFTPRYTDIHSSYSAWRNLIEGTAIGTESTELLTTYHRHGKTTSSNTTNTTWAWVTSPSSLSTESKRVGSRRVRRSRDGRQSTQHQLNDASDSDITSGFDDISGSSSTMGYQNRVLSDKEIFFCDHKPRRGYAQLAFSTPADFSKLNLDTFRQLCYLQSRIESSEYYKPNCELDCLCRSFSLVNYMTYLSSKHSCHDITQADVDSTVHLLNICRPYYERLPIDCWYDGQSFHARRCNVSDVCADEAIFEVYHFIISKNGSLSLTFVHMAQGKATHDLYIDLLDVIQSTKNEPVKLIALNFGLKEYVFEQSLKSDTCWISLALIIVILIIWLYTESIFITFMVFSSMLFTIILSYALYQFVFQIHYFPFLNLLAAVVVIGIGADDLFIYWKTWMAIKLNRNASILERIVTYTFRHASAAMFVTSASTATAFYACTYTDLVSIRCFCVYAGTCVLVHYLLVITWLPACVVVYEKYALTVCHTYGKESKIFKYLHRLHSCSTKLARTIQDRQSMISTLSYIWLPLFLIISTCGAIFLFVWPKFSPPSSDMFQMLTASHPFEVFDRDVKNNFPFISSHDYLPMIFVFGVEKEFNGDYFDVSSTGSLVLKPLPDLSLPTTQLWFSNFCAKLRQEPFFDRSGSQPAGCFIEELRVWAMFRSCDHDICCSTLRFPYNQSVFSYCLDKWAEETHPYKLRTADPGIRYKDGQPSVVIISFWSNVKFDYRFQSMQDFYQNVTAFLNSRVSEWSELSSVDFMPFFTSSGGLLFYDVQTTLLNSLPMSLVVVLSASAVIIFLTTLNVLLTLTALISISCSMLTTLGALALMRWELNILESVIVSLAVGLSMDFPLHIAVAYRMASSTYDRKRRVVTTLRHVGGSLTAAMCTTLVAGICMLPAQVLAYTRLGTFLTLVILSSWFYATFFMPALLVHIGPVGSFLQLDLRQCFKAKRPPSITRHLDKSSYSEEMSSEVTQPLPTSSSQSHLEPVIEESSEELELNELETYTSSSSLLKPSVIVRSDSYYNRLSPIAEHCGTSCDSDDSS